MKRLKIKIGGIGEKLTKEQTKKVIGGYGEEGDCVTYDSCPYKCGSNGYCSSCCIA